MLGNGQLFAGPAPGHQPLHLSVDVSCTDGSEQSTKKHESQSKDRETPPDITLNIAE
jgi:hypothetical protein